MRLIINADDYGYSENVTMAIVSSFKDRIITQTTAMSNMPWFERGMQLARDNGFINKVGLHINLTEGVPLTSEMRECRYFCDANGHFTGDFYRRTKTRLFVPDQYVRVVADEVGAQMRRFLENGGIYMHLDSHHHVHTGWGYARIILLLAKKYGFKTVRISSTVCDKMTIAKWVYKALFNHFVATCLTPISDEFTDYKGFTRKESDMSTKASVEIMVHPQVREGFVYDADRLMAGDAEHWKTRGYIWGVDAHTFS
jgi:predicted glycoside hydrolase/deacetylase ChbG (UPF0249 family)